MLNQISSEKEQPKKVQKKDISRTRKNQSCFQGRYTEYCLEIIIDFSKKNIVSSLYFYFILIAGLWD